MMTCPYNINGYIIRRVAIMVSDADQLHSAYKSVLIVCILDSVTFGESMNLLDLRSQHAHQEQR